MTTPIWLSVAQMFVGLAEVPGQVSNPVILKWAADMNTPSWYHDDDQPWCALFMNRLMRACGMASSGYGFDLIRAESFQSWGQGMAIPTLGSILVFKRSGGYHVGLYVGESKMTYLVLGGNQHNAVGVNWMDKSGLVQARWPSDIPLPAPRPVMITFTESHDPADRNTA